MGKGLTVRLAPVSEKHGKRDCRWIGLLESHTLESPHVFWGLWVADLAVILRLHVTTVLTLLPS